MVFPLRVSDRSCRIIMTSSVLLQISVTLEISRPLPSETMG